ncbi:endoribonuclease Dicer 3 [Pelomyxa schiedti]|nr:endoribonuclease Dicer 3 [Pelomyxa schiedti]
MSGTSSTTTTTRTQGGGVDDDGEGVAVMRGYQRDLLEVCKRGNTIVSLDTNTGKTLIAIRLAQWHHKRHPLKKILFVCQNVALSMQQASQFSEQCNLRVEALYGGSTSSKCWNLTISTTDVVVITAGSLKNELKKNPQLLSAVSLLILDECHHTTKDHPFNEIMGERHNIFDHGFPAPDILGLTASLASGDTLGETLVQVLRMCGNLRAVVVTADTSSFSQLIQEDLYEVVMDEPSTNLLRVIEKIINDCLNRLSWSKNSTCQDYYPWVKSQRLDRPELAIIRTLYKARAIVDDVSCSHAWSFIRDKLPEWSLHFPDDAQLFLQIENEIRSALFLDSNIQLPTQSAKLDALRDILSLVPTGHKILLFVGTRLNVTLIQKELAYLSIQMQGITGRSEKGMSPTVQEDVLRQFREGAFRLLLATSVVEEGLDVPDCNLVIRYDKIPSTASFVQSRGRARKAGSRFIGICHQMEAGRWQKMKQKEQAMKLAVKIVSTGIDNCNTVPSNVQSFWQTILDQTANLNKQYPLERKEQLLTNSEQHLRQTCSYLLEIEPKITVQDLTCVITVGKYLSYYASAAIRKSDAKRLALEAAVKDLMKRDLIIFNGLDPTRTEPNEPEELTLDPKIRLTKFCQSKGIRPPSYLPLFCSSVTVELSSGPVTVTSGPHPTTEEAENEAAVLALKRLGQQVFSPTRHDRLHTDSVVIDKYNAEDLLNRTVTSSRGRITPPKPVYVTTASTSTGTATASPIMTCQCHLGLSVNGKEIVFVSVQHPSRSDAKKDSAVRACTWLKEQNMLVLGS